MSQLEHVIDILREEGKIDNFRCIDTRLTTRLSSYIHILKKRGWQFRTEKDGKNYIYFPIKDPAKIEYPKVPEKYKVEQPEVITKSLF